eukprot:sb/3465453/
MGRIWMLWPQAPFLIGLCVGLILIGVFYAADHLNGSRYIPGTCELVTIDVDVDSAHRASCSYKDYSDREHWASYPCLKVYAKWFKDDGDIEGELGLLSYGLASAEEGCLLSPPCEAYEYGMEEKVIYYWGIVKQKAGTRFTCSFYLKKIIVEDSGDYSYKKGVIALVIPSIVIILWIYAIAMCMSWEKTCDYTLVVIAAIIFPIGCIWYAHRQYKKRKERRRVVRNVDCVTASELAQWQAERFGRTYNNTSNVPQPPESCYNTHLRPDNIESRRTSNTTTPDHPTTFPSRSSPSAPGQPSPSAPRHSAPPRSRGPSPPRSSSRDPSSIPPPDPSSTAPHRQPSPLRSRPPSPDPRSSIAPPPTLSSTAPPSYEEVMANSATSPSYETVAGQRHY